MVVSLTVLAFRKFKIEVDKKLVISCLPYLFILPMIRSLVDAGVYEYSMFLVTPCIFLLPPLLLLAMFVTISKLNKQVPYYISGITGIIIFLYIIGKIKVVNVTTPIVILIFTAILCGVLHIVFRYFEFMSKLEDCGPIYAHIFDAMTAIVGSTIGYKEAHIIPNLVISITGTQISFLIVKIIVPLLSIYLINKLILDTTTNRVFKGAIFVSGCFTGLRNFFRILMLC